MGCNGPLRYVASNWTSTRTLSPTFVRDAPRISPCRYSIEGARADWHHVDAPRLLPRTTVDAHENWQRFSPPRLDGSDARSTHVHERITVEDSDRSDEANLGHIMGAAERGRRSRPCQRSRAVRVTSVAAAHPSFVRSRTCRR